MTRRRLPPNLFSIPFGLAGLAAAWAYAGAHGLASSAVADVLSAIGGAVWLVVLGAYALQGDPRRVLARDLVDPVLGPFVSLALIGPLVLVTTGIVPHAPGLGRVLVDVLAAGTVLLGGWFTGQWIYGPLSTTTLHPGYFLPTVAGGLLGATATAAVGQRGLAVVLLGLGLVCWLILGSMILARLLLGPELPEPLYPTIAIEVAPAAVATTAYLAVHGDRVDDVVRALGGYGLLMALAQLRLLGAFRRLPFTPGFWSFTFSWAAVVTAALHWLVILQPAGWTLYAHVLLAAITGLIAAIAARTVLAIARGHLLPAAA